MMSTQRAQHPVVAAVDMTSLQQPLSAITGSNIAAAAKFMMSLRQSLSTTGSNYFAAATAGSNYVAAVDMTSLQQPLSAITGSNVRAMCRNCAPCCSCARGEIWKLQPP